MVSVLLMSKYTIGVFSLFQALNNIKTVILRPMLISELGLASEKIAVWLAPKQC